MSRRAAEDPRFPRRGAAGVYNSINRGARAPGWTCVSRNRGMTAPARNNDTEF